jgi:predicted esterase
MRSFLVTLLILLMPISAFTQTEFTLSDGSTFRAYFDTPGIGEHPLVVILGGGSGDASIASSAFRNHGDGFIDRGWAVVAPVSPNGQSFWGENGGKVYDLVATLKQRDDIADGPVLLMGISNGGISSLDIASRSPGNYLGIIAVPALASDSPQLAALKDFPVFLRIGSEDRLGWGSRFDDTVRVLERAEVVLDAQLLHGTGHTFPLDWDEVDAWLDKLPSR